jgi:hypothetical protein
MKFRQMRANKYLPKKINISCAIGIQSDSLLTLSHIHIYSVQANIAQ